MNAYVGGEGGGFGGERASGHRAGRLVLGGGVLAKVDLMIVKLNQ